MSIEITGENYNFETGVHANVAVPEADFAVVGPDGDAPDPASEETQNFLQDDPAEGDTSEKGKVKQMHLFKRDGELADQRNIASAAESRAIACLDTVTSRAKFLGKFGALILETAEDTRDLSLVESNAIYLKELAETVAHSAERVYESVVERNNALDWIAKFQAENGTTSAPAPVVEPVEVDPQEALDAVVSGEAIEDTAVLDAAADQILENAGEAELAKVTPL